MMLVIGTEVGWVDSAVNCRLQKALIDIIGLEWIQLVLFIDVGHCVWLDTIIASTNKQVIVRIEHTVENNYTVWCLVYLCVFIEITLNEENFNTDHFVVCMQHV